MVSTPRKISSPLRKVSAPRYGGVTEESMHFYHRWVTLFLFLVVIICVLCGYQGGLEPKRRVKDMDVSGDLTVDGTLTNKVPVTSITTATYTVTAAQSGTHFSLNRAAGIAVTLPTCASGLVYHFSVGTTFSGAGIINTAATDELYVGGLTINDPATAGDMNFFSADVANDDSIDLGSAAQGWLQGGQFKLVGLSATRWHVEGSLVGDGTLATPFE